MPAGHDPTRIFKSSTSPRKGIALSNYSTWKKVKVTVSNAIAASTGAATATYSPAGVSTSAPLEGGFPFSKDESAGGARDVTVNGKIIEYGNNSEVFIAYKNTIEVWDWFPSPLDNTPCTPKINQCGGTLYLTASKTITAGNGNGSDDANIVSFKPLNCHRDKNYYVLVVCLKIKKDYYFQLHSMGQPPPLSALIQQPLILPPSSFGTYPYTIKNTENFFIICTSEGCLNIFNKKKAANPLSNMVLEAKIFDNKPLFDLSGRWFVYVPNNTREIVQSLKKLNYKKKQYNKLHSAKKKNNGFRYGDDNTMSEDLDELSLELDVTPLKLPKSGPLLNRLIKSLSSTAIDGALKLSEIGTNKVRTYILNQKTEDASRPPDSMSKENMKNIKNSLSNFINANNDAKKNIKSLQFVVIIDLITEQPMAIFSPPGSISNISLSPYDAHLATCSTRGDNVYIWDLSRIPKEVSLIAKHNRGRTPSSIDQLLWNTGNSAIGLVTRATGSVHWFNNYTDSAASPNLNSDWILSGLKSRKICLGPKAAELSFSKSSSKSPTEPDNFEAYLTSYNFKENTLSQNLIKSCILSLDSANSKILVISPTDGSISWQYEIPAKPIPTTLLPDYLTKHLVKEDDNEACENNDDEVVTHKNLTNYGSDCIVKKDYNHIDPLSEIELETCDSFTPLYKNRRFQFGSYNFSKAAEMKARYTKNDDLFVTTEPLDPTGAFDVSTIPKGTSEDNIKDSEIFERSLNVFGKGFTVNVFHFGRGTGLPVFHDTDFEDVIADDDDLLAGTGNSNLLVDVDGDDQSPNYKTARVKLADTQRNGGCSDVTASRFTGDYGIKSLRNAMESLLIETKNENFF